MNIRELFISLDNEEQKQKAAQVIRQVQANIKVKNYFGWRSFIDEVAADLLGQMMKTEFKYSVGAYITCGMQSALDHCRYCNALKRRGDFEHYSLDEEFLSQIPDEYSNPARRMEQEAKCDELYLKIKLQFGQALADQLKPVIYDEDSKIERKTLKLCKTEEFKEFLSEELSL